MKTQDLLNQWEQSVDELQVRSSLAAGQEEEVYYPPSESNPSPRELIIIPLPKNSMGYASLPC